jgi:hypothetical protein
MIDNNRLMSSILLGSFAADPQHAKKPGFFFVEVPTYCEIEYLVNKGKNGELGEEAIASLEQHIQEIEDSLREVEQNLEDYDRKAADPNAILPSSDSEHSQHSEDN